LAIAPLRLAGRNGSIDRRVRNDPEKRLRNLRDAIKDVIEILESVKERARGFVVKQVEAEKASAEAQLKLDYLKTQLAEQYSLPRGLPRKRPWTGRHASHSTPMSKRTMIWVWA
jgi:hypothetical protein